MSSSITPVIPLPAAELLSLASRALRNLYLAQEKEHQRLVSLGPDYEDQADAVVEDITDTTESYVGIDPVSYYHERQRFGKSTQLCEFHTYCGHAESCQIFLHLPRFVACFNA